MSFQARTYYCGQNGGVRKLVDLVAPWTDVSLPGNGIPEAFQSELFDIEVDPNNGDKVYVVGEAHVEQCGMNWFGIAVSSNGGVTWQVPGGAGVTSYKNVVDAATCYHKWIEVSVVDSNTIYVCGIVNTNTNKGTVIKSIDGGLTFNMCSPLPALLDGMNVNSIHFTSPTVGVIGLDNYICKTVDGGVTWNIMNGGQPISTAVPFPGTPLVTGPITGIRIKSDQSSVIAICDSFVFQTIPAFPINSAGMAVDSWIQNVYPPVGFPFPIGKHLSYLNPAVAGENWISVSGIDALGMESATNGTSWNFAPAPGYDVLGTGFNRIAAHFYKLNNNSNGQVGFYNKDNDLYAGNYGFNPSFEAFSETSPYGINAVWTWYLENPSPPPTCYRATNCDGSFIITDTDLSVLVGTGAYFNIVGYAGCFVATVNSDCSGVINITVGTQRFVNCAECNPPPPICYELVDCSNSFPPIKTNTDLSASLGKTVTLNNYPGICWEVIQPLDCTGSSPLTSTITSTFVDCPSCLQKCYKLTDCIGVAPAIITTTDLSAYINKVIKINGCPPTCYFVTASNTCTGSIVVVLDTAFDTCEACNPPIPVPEVPLLTRKVQPNYGGGLCSPDIIESVNCGFADQIYNKVIQAKYGIDICKEDELDKWIIKKELLELNLIYDPLACVVAPTPVVCDPVVIVPPIPVPCSEPTGLVVTMTDPPATSCGVPVVTDVEIVYEVP